MIAVCSLGGAPGVTTLALALAGMWPTDVPAVVVEADAKGGDLAAWRGLSPSPGTAELVAAARHSTTTNALAHGQELPGGLRICPAPASADRAQALVALLAQNPHVLHPGEDAVCVVDLGRLAPRSAAAHLARAATVVVLVSGDDPAQLKRLQESLPALRSGTACLGVALWGTRESVGEVAAAVQAPVWARIPHDTRGAAFIRGQRHDARPQRLPLLAAAQRLGQHLVEEVATSRSPAVETGRRAS